jgi:hypothetical protein
LPENEMVKGEDDGGDEADDEVGRKGTMWIEMGRI